MINGFEAVAALVALPFGTAYGAVPADFGDPSPVPPAVGLLSVDVAFAAFEFDLNESPPVDPPEPDFKGNPELGLVDPEPIGSLELSPT